MGAGVPFSVDLNPLLFDNLINYAGVSVAYRKSHDCPCTFDMGTKNPRCQVCAGVGTYWDDPSQNYTVLMTGMTFVTRSVAAAGWEVQDRYGPMMEGKMVLTIPQSTAPYMWQEAALYDIVTRQGELVRYNLVLRLGQNPYIPPLFSNVTVAVSGAITVYDVVENTPVSGVAYTVGSPTASGVPVFITDPDYNMLGQGFTVEFYAEPSMVLIDEMSGPHTRPFGQGGKYPRRFQLSYADEFMRNRVASSTLVQGSD